MHDTHHDDRRRLYDVENGVRKFPQQSATESPINDRIHVWIFNNGSVHGLELGAESYGQFLRTRTQPVDRFRDVGMSLARDP